MRSCSASRSCSVEGYDAPRSCYATSRSTRSCSASRSCFASRSCSVEEYDATAMSIDRMKGSFEQNDDYVSKDG